MRIKQIRICSEKYKNQNTNWLDASSPLLLRYIEYSYERLKKEFGDHIYLEFRKKPNIFGRFKEWWIDYWS